MENKKHRFWRVLVTGALSVLLLIPSCLWGTRPLYAEGEAPTKQTLGNMLITLLASFGVKTYIGVANSAQWIADNYDQFVSTVGGLKSAYQIYEEVENTYDATTGKSTLSADAYNSIAQYVRNFMATYDVVDDSEPVEVGTYLYTTSNSYLDLLQNVNYMWMISTNSPLYRKRIMTSTDTRLAIARFPVNGKHTYVCYVVSLSPFQYSNSGGSSWWDAKNYTLNGVTYYVGSDSVGDPEDSRYPLEPSISYTDFDTFPDSRYQPYYDIGYNLTYGDMSAGEELADNIYYQGDQSLNDMVSTTDQNAVFDWSKVAGIDKTLAEILEAVNEIALSDAWDTVNFPVPNAKEPVPSVPVPDNTPIPPWWDNIPELEAPTCPTLSACIVSGARAVSNNITSLMNLHSELAIYTGVGLSLGLALLIIGAFRR